MITMGRYDIDKTIAQFKVVADELRSLINIKVDMCIQYRETIFDKEKEKLEKEIKALDKCFEEVYEDYNVLGATTQAMIYQYFKSLSLTEDSPYDTFIENKEVDNETER